MRLPYVPDPVPTADAADAAIVARVRQRRLPGPLLPLDRALLHAPAVADGWNSFFGTIRTGTSLSQDVRELAIARVAVLNRAHFEWKYHAPLAAEAGVAAPDIVRGDSPAFSAKLKAVVAYTDAMTTGVAVPEAVFAALQEHFTAREVVELTTTVAAYNCASRVLVALDIGEESKHMDVQKWT